MENKYINRDIWGARFAAGAGPRNLPCDEAWLHHTVTRHLREDATLEEEYAQMRVVESIGQDRFGRGFSYSLAIFPSGRVYVGCGVRRVGTHTGNHNTRALGIVLVGNYQVNPMTAPQRKTLAATLRDAVAEGWLTEPKLTGGHRDLKKTSCPGEFAYSLISDINHMARVGTVGESPSIFDPPPLPRPKDDEMFTLLQVTDATPNKLYAYSAAKLFHISSMELFWAMVACGSFPHVDSNGNAIARRVTQAQVDATKAVVNAA